MSHKKSISVFSDRMSAIPLFTESRIVEKVNHPSKAKVVVFNGGLDVDPTLYKDEKGYFTKTMEYSDKRDNETFDEAIGNSLLVGISRGAQFLAAKAGCKIFQQVTGHNRPHRVFFYDGLHDKYNINSDNIYISSSTHNQMMDTFSLSSTKEDMMSNDIFDIIAYAEPLSAYYLDGNNKMIDPYKRYGERFVEPELVYFKYLNALAIQGHPESNLKSEYTRVIINIIESLL